jgi:nitroreductase
LNDLTFFDVVAMQRACRRFRPEPVPDADIVRMLDAAVHAPSAENAQPWVFVVVRDAARRQAIGDLAGRLWDGGVRQRAQPRLGAALFEEVDESIRAGFGGAPVLVVVAGNGRDATTRRVLGASVFPAVQNLLLAAGALGYGSALTTLTTFAAEELRAVVELPAGVEPLAVVPLGRPAHALGPPRRDPAASKTHLDRYGLPFATRDLRHS